MHIDYPLIAFAFLLAVLAALVIRRYILFVTKVSSFSMYPSLHPNQLLLTLHRHLFRRIQRGDIIVFYSSDFRQDLIKRVIGLPGDRIDIRDGKVYLNHPVGKLGDDCCTFLVPEGSYFVLGDNRLLSKDSRHFKDPYVPRKAVVGKVLYSLYPFHKLEKVMLTEP